MKKNRFHGTFQDYNEAQSSNQVKDPVKKATVRSRPKNRFTGFFDKYNTNEPAQQNEAFTPDQKKLLGDSLEELKNTIVGAIAGGGPVKKNDNSEFSKVGKEFADLQSEVIKKFGEDTNRMQALFTKAH